MAAAGRRLPPGCLLALAATTLVLLWGVVDPFGLRQRLDWLVTDQYLRHRPLPPLHPDLVAIVVDDRAAALLGNTADRRHRLARALAQLPRLRPRTVLVDYAFLDWGSSAPFDHEEAIYQGIPLHEAIPLASYGRPLELAASVRQRFREDRLLAAALQGLGRCAIPFALADSSSLARVEEQAVDSAARLLAQHPDWDAAAVRRRLGLGFDERLFGPAVARAARQIAAQSDGLLAALVRAPYQSAERLADQLGLPAAVIAVLVAANGGRAASAVAVGIGRKVLRAAKSKAQHPQAPWPQLLQRAGLPAPDRFPQWLAESWPASALEAGLDRLARRLAAGEPLKPETAAQELGLAPADAPSLALLAAQRVSELAGAGGLPLSRLRSPLLQRLPRAVGRHWARQALQRRCSFSVHGADWLPAVAAVDVPAEPFARSAAMGFANVAAGQDSDGTIRRLPVAVRWGDRVLVHQAVAAVALHLGLDIRRLRCRAGRFLLLGPDRAVPLNRRGCMTINWPYDAAESWERIPRISLADLLALAQYEADIQVNRWNQRLTAARLLRLTSPAQGWWEHFWGVIDSYRSGELSDARRNLARFDEKMAELVAGARQLGTAGTEPADDQAGRLRADLLELAEAVESLSAERQAKLNLLRDGDGRRPGLAGKLCLVGEAATGSVDFQQSCIGNVPGVAVVAAAANTILTGQYLSRGGLGTAMATTVLLAGLLSVLFLRLSAGLAGLCCLLGLLAAVVGHWLALRYASLLTSPVLPMTGTAAAYLTIASHRWRLERRQKRMIRHAFSFYLHPSLVAEVSDNPQMLRLGGEEKDLTVLFADIRDFSRMAEQLPAPDLVALLNEYFSAATRQVIDQQGYLDKYIGDAVMAIFGAPVQLADHAYRACCSALAMRACLWRLQRDWQRRGLPSPQVGIGINTGPMVVGNLGSADRLNYTVIGDAVNLAARLEAANKRYGTVIIISESTWQEVGERLATRELDLIRVKGRRQPTRIFELLGHEQEVSPQRRAAAERFEQALAAYRCRRWEQALTTFRQLLAERPDDGPARLYAARCEQFLAHAPPPNWDGVYEMEVK